MNSEGSKIDNLKEELNFSCKKDLLAFPIIWALFLVTPNIIDSLNLFCPTWRGALEGIIQKNYSPQYTIIVIIVLLVISILLSIIWSLGRRCILYGKITRLQENDLSENRLKITRLENDLSGNRLKVNLTINHTTINTGTINLDGEDLSLSLSRETSDNVSRYIYPDKDKALRTEIKTGD